MDVYCFLHTNTVDLGGSLRHPDKTKDFDVIIAPRVRVEPKKCVAVTPD